MHVKWNRNLDGIRRSNSPTNSSSSSMTVTSSGSGSSTDSDDLPFADSEESSNGGCAGGGIGDTRSMNHTLRKNFLARMTQSDSADFSAPMLPRPPPHQVTDLAEAALAHPRQPETKDENSESDENSLMEHRGTLSNHQNSLLLFHNNNNNNSPMDVQYQTTTTTTNSGKQGLANCTAQNTKLNSVSTTPNGGQATSQNFKSRKRDNFALKLTSSRRQLIANHLRQQSALLSFRSSNSPSPMRPQSSAASPMSNRITSKGALATLIGLFRFRDSVDDLNNNNNGSNSGFKSHARHFRRRLSLERLTTNSTSSHNGNPHPAPSQSTVPTSPNCRQPLLERHPAGTSLRYRQRSNSLLMLQDIALSPDYGPQPSQNHNVASQNSPEFLPELTAPPLPPKPAPPVAVEINPNHQQQQEQKSSTDSPGVPIGAPSSCDSTNDDHIDNNHTTSDNHNNNNNNNLAVDNNRLDNHYFDDNLENCVPIIDHSQLTPISTHSPRSPSTNQNHHHHHNHLSPAIITATALITETPRKSLVKFINDEPSYTILDPGCRSFLEHNHQHNHVTSTKSSKPLQGILRVRNNNNFYGDSPLDSLRSSSASSSLSSNSSGSFSGASSGGSGGAPTVTTNHKRVRFARPLLTYAIIEGS